MSRSTALPVDLNWRSAAASASSPPAGVGTTWWGRDCWRDVLALNTEVITFLFPSLRRRWGTAETVEQTRSARRSALSQRPPSTMRASHRGRSRCVRPFLYVGAIFFIQCLLIFLLLASSRYVLLDWALRQSQHRKDMARLARIRYDLQHPPEWLTYPKEVLSASRVHEVHVRLATLTALNAPPPPGAESWLDALASFLGGGAGWTDVLRGRGAGGVDVDAATLASAGLVLRVLRERDGYARARGADASEREAHRPMDDVALLQWRHELSASTRGAARAPANASSSASSAAAATAVRMHLYGASSVLNRRYYYGVRRAERAAPYASASVWTTKAWYDAVAGSALWDVYGDAGVPDAEATSRADSVRLRMHDLSAARVREVEQYESHGDLLPPRGDARADVPTIFVSLASYRDVQCAPTLVDLFQKAKNAHRVYVGLAEQNRAGDASCMAPLELHEPSACLTPAAASDASDADVARVWASVFGGGALGGGPAREAVDDARRGVCFYADHVRVRTIDADEAKGPTYGRYMAMLLYRGETLTLVLDSHNRFTPFWDTLATHQYYRYDDPKTVLSHYPASLTDELKQRGSDSHFWVNSTRYECGALFRRWSLVRMVAADVPAESVGSVYYWANNLRNDPYVSWQAAQHDARSNFRLPQPWVAGGFLFTNASIMREVPFDPHLPHIFDGEEVLYSVRLWTHGYNIFSPVANVVFHDYHRTKPLVPSLDDARSEPIRERSEERTGFLMRARRRKGSNTLAFPQNSTMPHLTADSDRYGCGRERTVEQWHWYAGVDPVNLVIAGHWC